jgi:hypothetical protein
MSENYVKGSVNGLFKYVDVLMLYPAGLVQEQTGEMAETETRGTRADPEVTRGTCK